MTEGNDPNEEIPEDSWMVGNLMPIKYRLYVIQINFDVFCIMRKYNSPNCFLLHIEYIYK